MSAEGKQEKKTRYVSTYEEILESATPLPENLRDLEGHVNSLMLKDFVKKGEVTASFPPRYFRNRNSVQGIQLAPPSHKVSGKKMKSIEMDHVSTVIPTDPLSSGIQSLLVYAKGSDGQVYLLKRNFNEKAHREELNNASILVELGLMPKGTGRTVVNNKTYLAIPLVGGRVVVNTFKDPVKNLNLHSLRDLEVILYRLYKSKMRNPEAINEMDLIATREGRLLLIDAGYLELKSEVSISRLNGSDASSYAAFTEKRFEVLMSMDPKPVEVLSGQMQNPGLFYLEQILKPQSQSTHQSSRLGAWHGLVYKIYHAEGQSPMLLSLKRYAKKNIAEATVLFKEGYLYRD